MCVNYMLCEYNICPKKGEYKERKMKKNITKSSFVFTFAYWKNRETKRWRFK